MRDPTVDVRVEEAVRRARTVLGLYMRLGAFRRCREEDPAERNLRSASRISITMAAWRRAIPRLEAEFVCRMLNQPQPIGRPTYANRNLFIVRMVEDIKQRGFAPTRNDTMRDIRESACSIVAKALAQLGLNLSERSIEDIWTGSRRMGNSHQ